MMASDRIEKLAVKLCEDLRWVQSELQDTGEIDTNRAAELLYAVTIITERVVGRYKMEEFIQHNHRFLLDNGEPEGDLRWN